MAKKIKDLSELGGFVFSTNKDFEFEQEHEIETLPNDKQLLEVHLDKKNRNGKIATLIKGFQGNEQDFKMLSKKLKTLCGVGGSQKDNEIIIQGDFRDKIIEFLKKENYKVKRVGG
ncbi:MAG: translation initiation factor [Bacteroidota bacterium]|nr:translation initiation factor [Bacteroidota bacterium]